MSRPARNSDLHGNAPENADTALVLIDVLNDFDFEGGASLWEQTRKIADNLAALKQSAADHGVPVIYVNDNAGKWQSNSKRVWQKAIAARSRGRDLALRLRPDSGDYIVLKPKQSAFFGTPLEILLDHLKARRLVLAGIAADICVYFTAQDAFLRDYEVCVPSDGIAAQTRAAADGALKRMRKFFKVRTARCRDVAWKA